MRISDWSSDVCSSDLEVVACGPIEAECHRLGVAFDVALQRDRKAPADMRGVEQRTVGAVVDIQLVAAALFDAHDQRAIFGGQRRSEEHTYELQSLMRQSYSVVRL